MSGPARRDRAPLAQAGERLVFLRRGRARAVVEKWAEIMREGPVCQDDIVVECSSDFEDAQIWFRPSDPIFRFGVLAIFLLQSKIS